MFALFSKLFNNKNTSIHPTAAAAAASSDDDDNDSGVELKEELKEELEEELEEELPESDKIYVRLACGKIEEYYGYHTYTNGSNILIDKYKNKRTGPFYNLDEMLVAKDALPYRYVHPYEKDINGTINKNDGKKSVCKNCEAYAEWEQVGEDIMICTERCLTCSKMEYIYKVMRIQRRWRDYKNI